MYQLSWQCSSLCDCIAPFVALLCQTIKLNCLQTAVEAGKSSVLCLIAYAANCAQTCSVYTYWVFHYFLKALYVHSRFTVNPDRVYRIAMRMLNTHAGILEVMGAPLYGTNIRAYMMSGGGVTLKKFGPRLRSNRCFLIFPVRGSEREGLVSVEVKKKKGQVCFYTCLPSSLLV